MPCCARKNRRSEAGFVEEMSRRLLALRTVTQSHTQAVRAALAVARDLVIAPPPEAGERQVSDVA